MPFDDLVDLYPGEQFPLRLPFDDWADGLQGKDGE
jgi:hypothetical protein